MYTVLLSKRYIKQLKRMSSRKDFDIRALQDAVKILEKGIKVPAKYKDHQLKGECSNYRELHVKHDLLLVYCKDDSELVLVLIALGTHSSLFG